MNKDQKAAVVDEIAAQISEAQAVIAVDYRGTSVPQAAELRAKLRDADTTFRIVKNSLTERAAAKAGADTLKGLLEGPTAFAFVHGDPAAAAKALNDFTRELDSFQFKGGVMDGTPLSVDELKVIARLPTREVLDAQLVGMVASPLTGLVRGLNGLISGLALQLGQIAEQGPRSRPRNRTHRRPTPDARRRPRRSLTRPTPKAQRPTPPKNLQLTKARSKDMATTQEWIDELKGISVLELSERIKALEEEFGVSATAAVAAAPAAASGDGADAEEESSTVDVILTGPGDKKIQVIKVVRAATGLGLKEAKALVDEAPKPVKEGIEREEADKLVADIEEAGGTVELK